MSCCDLQDSAFRTAQLRSEKEIPLPGEFFSHALPSRAPVLVFKASLSRLSRTTRIQSYSPHRTANASVGPIHLIGNLYLIDTNTQAVMMHDSERQTMWVELF